MGTLCPAIPPRRHTALRFLLVTALSPCPSSHQFGTIVVVPSSSYHTEQSLLTIEHGCNVYYQLNPECMEKVHNSCGKWPMSPSILQLTVPVGRMVK